MNPNKGINFNTPNDSPNFFASLDGLSVSVPLNIEGLDEIEHYGDREWVFAVANIPDAPDQIKEFSKTDVLGSALENVNTIQ